MTVIAIIQARMSSTRLPGKVLLPLVNKPVLAHVVERLAYSRLIEKIVVATSVDSTDNPIFEFCCKKNVSCFRGSLEDVLDRYYQTATQFDASAVVRITADCPVIDPVVVDAVITGFLSGNYDLYGLDGEFPDGLDCAVFSMLALKQAWLNAQLKSEREHVGPYLKNNPHHFQNGSLKIFKGLQHHRWTLDEPEDYLLLTEIFETLYNADSPFLTHDVLQLIQKKPELLTLNQAIIRNEGYLKSIQNDGVYK
jgi:spore coat polysaccharide biosynthesis protein SpsF (cytidylyltransferase family)